MHTSFGLKGTRQGSAAIMHSFPVDYTMTVAARKVTIRATATKPKRVRFGLLTDTAWNGTTPTFGVGSTSAATEFLNNVTPAGAGSDFGTPVTKLIVADTDVYVKAGGGGSNTAGSGYVTITIEELNVIVPNNQ